MATANTTNQHELGLSQQDELLQQMLSKNAKRTASANNPNYDFETKHPFSTKISANQKNFLVSDKGQY